MRRSKIFLLIFLLVVIFAISLYIWVNYSPATSDYRWNTYVPETESDLASNFAYGLSINQPVIYNWVNPDLIPRLDEWMNTHQIRKCTHEYDWFFSGLDENDNYDVSFGCFGENGRIRMEVDNIVIKDMKVVDWGEVREGD